ncbi:hypothetical protein KSU01_01275 [Fusobacterium animalis]|uniref:hypothetical protein n=1 Tax=Fusobacterium animalis TaxID=76859 RepID=UPI0030CEB265
MNILYITTSLLKNESASIRNISLINGLIENNCKVKVVTLDYVKNLEDTFLRDSLDSNVEVEKIKIPNFNKLFSLVQKVKENKKIGNSFFFKIKNLIKEFIFFPDVYFESIKNSKGINIMNEKFDYIISSSDSKTSHFIAREIIKSNNLIVPWIQIWGDPWSNDIGIKNCNFLTKYRIKKNEKKLLKEADKIFYISELTANKIKDKFSELSGKIYTLSRSYLKEIDSENENNKIIFSYTGSIKNRNLFPLIESIDEYNKQKNNQKQIEFNLYGVDLEIKNLESKKFINIYPRLSFKEILEVYKKSDVLIYIDNLHNSTQIPGKIYDYFGTNKVILALYENEKTKNFLEKYNRVELIFNKDKFSLNNIIKKVNTNYVLKDFSPKIVAKNFLKNIQKG